MKRRHLTPARLIALGFLAIILAGTVLLMLPCASKAAPVSFLSALFTSTSATCVTGLIVCDTYTTWTVFGQLVILGLIQLGGLGFMTVITLISFALGKHLGLYDRKVLMQSAGNLTLNGIGRLIRRIIPFTFVFEAIGALLLATQLVPEFGWGQGSYMAVFHAVSAFCNAGFDLMGIRKPFSSLTAYTTNWVVNITVDLLVIIGGLGFLVWRDLAANRFRFKKCQLHTKLALTATVVLLLGGWVFFALFEWNGALSGLTVPQKLLAALFLSVSPRTAGFNTVDLASLSEAGNLLTDVLMLVGGCPGSTAGGIKTTTIAVLLLSAAASARGRSRVEIFHYSIDDNTLKQAGAIVTVYLVLALSAVCAVCAMEPLTLKQALFEVFSAIATVGLTLGATPTLSAGSKLLLVMLMYAGRIGGMTFVLLFSERRREPPRERPSGKILIG